MLNFNFRFNFSEESTICNRLDCFNRIFNTKYKHNKEVLESDLKCFKLFKYRTTNCFLYNLKLINI